MQERIERWCVARWRIVNREDTSPLSLGCQDTLYCERTVQVCERTRENYWCIEGERHHHRHHLSLPFFFLSSHPLFDQRDSTKERKAPISVRTFRTFPLAYSLIVKSFSCHPILIRKRERVRVSLSVWMFFSRYRNVCVCSTICIRRRHQHRRKVGKGEITKREQNKQTHTYQDSYTGRKARARIYTAISFSIAPSREWRNIPYQDRTSALPREKGRRERTSMLITTTHRTYQ